MNTAVEVRPDARTVSPTEDRPVIMLPLVVPARAAKVCAFPQKCKWPFCSC